MSKDQRLFKTHILSKRLVLLVILFFQFAFGVMYAVRTPMWQAPDEPAHFNYVRDLADTGTFPVLMVGDYDQAYLERIKSEKFPPELSVDSIRYEAHQPPLYYVAATPVYLVANALNVNAALALRLLNVGLGVVVSVLAFMILGLVFPTNPVARLAGVGIIATLPMHIAMSAAINNDTLAEVGVATVLLLAVLRLNGRLERRRYIILGGVVYGIALLTKTTIYSSAALLIAAEFGRQRMLARQETREERVTNVQPRRHVFRDSIRTLAPLLALSLVIAGFWFVRNAIVYGANDLFGWNRHDLVVAGQPTTAQFIAANGLSPTVVDWLTISFRSFWAQFGWMGVLVDSRIYTLLLILSAIASAGAILMLVRMWRNRAQVQVETMWTWLLLGLLLALVIAADVYYSFKFFQPQGRYLFYALIPIAAFWSGGLYELAGARFARYMFVALYVLMLGLDYFALTRFIVPQLAR